MSFVRRCRTIIQVLGETIAAIKLGQSAEWPQAMFDATSRRGFNFQAFIVSTLTEDENVLDPIIVSSCIVPEDESAQAASDCLFRKV